VVIGGRNGRLVGLDYKLGTVLWSYQLIGDYKNVLQKLIQLTPEKSGILIFVPSYKIMEQIQLPDVLISSNS
jgi:hypothetical protein